MKKGTLLRVGERHAYSCGYESIVGRTVSLYQDRGEYLRVQTEEQLRAGYGNGWTIARFDGIPIMGVDNEYASMFLQKEDPFLGRLGFPTRE